MTVEFIGHMQNTWAGLSTDTKPSVGVPTMSRFTESDTGLTYKWDGSSWYPDLTHLGLSDGNPISAQHPLPTDGDSVYAKDVWVETSNINGFSGSVLDLFDDLHTTITDTSATNPKEIFVHFNRTTPTTTIGIGAHTGNFSNIKITALVSGPIEITLVDETTNDTKYTSRQFDLTTVGFNALRIQFHTTDAVTLSNLFILKAKAVVSRITAQKPDDTFVELQATESNNLKTANAEDTINIARGNVAGYSTVHKFGRGSNINTADGLVDLWDGAEYDVALKTYTFSTTADIDTLSSESTADTEPIEIFGLDGNWDLVTQTITLTGQTPVALTTPLIRVFRLKNSGSNDLVGHVFCFVNVNTTIGVPDTIINIRAIINGANNQTLMAIYTIPAGKTAYIKSWFGALSSAKASSFNNLEMKARPFGGVFQLKHTSTLSSAGSSRIQHDYYVPQEFPARTDFIMRSDSSINDNAVSAGFDLIMIDD